MCANVNQRIVVHQSRLCRQFKPSLKKKKISSWCLNVTQVYVLWKLLGIPESCAHCLQLSSKITLLYEPHQGAHCYKNFSWLLSDLNYSQLNISCLRREKQSTFISLRRIANVIWKRCWIRLLWDIPSWRGALWVTEVVYWTTAAFPEAGKSLLAILHHCNSCHVQNLLQEIHTRLTIIIWKLLGLSTCWE